MPETADPVILYEPEDGSLEVLTIERKATPYKGDRAFPGGHIDPEDYEKAEVNERSAGFYAALREAREEANVSADELEPVQHSNGEYSVENTGRIWDPRFETEGDLFDKEAYSDDEAWELMNNLEENIGHKGDEFYNETAVFRYRPNEDSEIAASSDAADAKFVPVDEVSGFMAFGHHKVLEWALDKYKRS